MTTPPGRARLSRVDALRERAAVAADVRALSTHPDVIAVQVERVRSQVDRLMWTGILLGLGFTMVNVQTFAAVGATPGSLRWLTAWLLDPMVSLVLIAILRAEQITARWQVPVTGPWARRTKWFSFAATYAMNTWQSWTDMTAAGIVLHSVPPVLVLCAAEAGPYLRDRLTEAVVLAVRHHRQLSPAPAGIDTDVVSGAWTVPPPAEPETATDTATGAVEAAAPDTTATTPASRAARTPRRRAARPPRMLLPDFVKLARDQLTASTHLTPAWVREVTGCGRGMATRVAATLRAERDAADAPVKAVSRVEGAREAA